MQHYAISGYQIQALRLFELLQGFHESTEKTRIEKVAHDRKQSTTFQKALCRVHIQEEMILMWLTAAEDTINVGTLDQQSLHQS
jgi:hypothetical protein